MRSALAALDVAWKLVGEAASEELQNTLQATDEQRQAIANSRAKRGKGTKLVKTAVTFQAVCRLGTRTTTVGKHYRAIVQEAHLLQAHARQAVRTQMPVIDGATVTQFTQELQDREQDAQPDDTRTLRAKMLRTSRALASARDGHNWHAVRRRCSQHTGQWVREAETLLEQRKRQEAKEGASSWKKWCRTAEEGGQQSPSLGQTTQTRQPQRGHRRGRPTNSPSHRPACSSG